MVEWAPWWDQTIQRWQGEGLPQALSYEVLLDYFRLDKLLVIGAGGYLETLSPAGLHGTGILTDEVSYEAMLPCLYTDETIDELVQAAHALKEQHAPVGKSSSAYGWMASSGFRARCWASSATCYAFYDQPELMHRINADLAEFNLRVVRGAVPGAGSRHGGLRRGHVLQPRADALQRAVRRVPAPYYQQVIPQIKKRGRQGADRQRRRHHARWCRGCIEAGIEGVLPAGAAGRRGHAPHPAGVPRVPDDGRLRQDGHAAGEAAMRAEFERLLPVMRSGGYIPSVDHQTPPGRVAGELPGLPAVVRGVRVQGGLARR